MSELVCNIVSNAALNAIYQFRKRISKEGSAATGKRLLYYIWNEFIGALLAHLAASVVKPVISSVVKGNAERGVLRAGREYYNSLDKIKITKYFNYESWFNSVF